MVTREELKTLVIEHEEFAEEMGWDMPPVLLVSNTKSELEIYSIVGGHPYDALVQMKPFEDVEWAVLVTEGWTYPKHVTEQYSEFESLQALAQRQPPSEHPQRVETRQVTGVSPDYVVFTQRTRGGEAEILDDVAELGGRVVDQLVRLVRGGEG